MPVFVVTHRPHDVVVKGATTFTFVTEGVKHAIEQASVAAGDKLVHIMGGASIIQQALAAGLVDELFLHVAPVILGSGTRLFEHLGGPIQLERAEVIESRHATQTAVPDPELARRSSFRYAVSGARWQRAKKSVTYDSA